MELHTRTDGTLSPFPQNPGPLEDHKYRVAGFSRAVTRTATPPGSAAADALYIVLPGATGAFATHDGEVARGPDTAWTFEVPQRGWQLWVDDAGANYVYDGAAWVPAAAPAQARPSASNKAMTAALTAADFALACATAIAATPAGDYVRAFVNGLAVELGDGVRTKDCYFSADGGATARAISAIAAGDHLYWVGSVAGYELATTDRIDLDYEV